MDFVSELWSSMAISGKTVVLLLAVLSIYSYAVMVERALALRWVRERSAELETDTTQGRDADFPGAGIVGPLQDWRDCPILAFRKSPTRPAKNPARGWLPSSHRRGSLGDDAVGIQRLHPRRSQGRRMLEGIAGWDTYFRAGIGAHANAQNP